MSKKPVFILAGVLTLIGLAVFAYKILELGYPVAPDRQADVWEIEVQVRFAATDKPAKLSLYTPVGTSRIAILERRLVAPGYGLVTENDGPNQRAVVSIRRASGEQVIYYRVTLQRTSSAKPAQPDIKPEIVAHGLGERELKAAESIANDANERSADRATLVATIVQKFAESPRDANTATIVGPRATDRGIALAVSRTLSVAGVPARVVNGIVLDRIQRQAKLVRWVEAHVDGRWVGYNLTTGLVGAPDGAVVWWRGDRPLFSLNGGARPRLNIATARLEETALANLLKMARARSDDLIGFSLYSLPLRTQHVYRLLVVVPIGIFILVILRNVIGLSTLGTFMPVLIALAFRETQLVWGLILFTVVVGAGLLVRAYLETLKLLLVPRLAAVLICVVLLMAVLSVFTHKLGFDKGLSVALFPMVIMTMTIERISILWDERGAKVALQQAVGSLAVATLCYLVMNITVVEHQLFTFPELLLIILALTLLLGRYTGYRLVELPRFKVLAGAKS